MKLASALLVNTLIVVAMSVPMRSLMRQLPPIPGPPVEFATQQRIDWDTRQTAMPITHAADLDYNGVPVQVYFDRASGRLAVRSTHWVGTFLSGSTEKLEKVFQYSPNLWDDVVPVRSGAQLVVVFYSRTTGGCYLLAYAYPTPATLEDGTTHFAEPVGLRYYLYAPGWDKVVATYVEPGTLRVSFLRNTGQSAWVIYSPPSTY
jgi:hypothetical protein